MIPSNILVIDDDPDICAVVGAYLQAEDHAVRFAPDGITGLSMAQKERPDLILLDLGLPAGDGITVLKRLKGLSRLADVPVLVVTGRDPGECQDEVMKSDAAGFLQKPLEKETFFAAVYGCLGVDPKSGTKPARTCSHCGHPVEPSLDTHTVEEIALKVARAVANELCSS